MLTGRQKGTREYPLSYVRMGALVGNIETVIEHDHYEAYWTPMLGVASFIFLYRTKPNQYQLNLPPIPRTSGYKIHVSIYDSKNDDDNLEQAWDIFVKCVLKHDISNVKIIAPSCRENLRQNAEERGKEITIYSFKEIRPVEQWKLFFEEVTRE